MPVMPGRPAARPAGLYQHEPTQVRAITWTGTNMPEIVSFFGRDFTTVPLPGTGLCIVLTSRTGPVYALPGDILIEDPHGDTQPVAPDDFARDYTLIEAQPA